MVWSVLKAIGRPSRTSAEAAAATGVAVPPPAPLPGHALDPTVAELLVAHPKLVDNVKILGERLGQARSVAERRPVDALGRPIPWYTYPAIEYLERLSLEGTRIFEFGCGNSTRYWCRRGASVTAVEHSRDWFDEVTDSLDSADLLYR